jgi:hypothetical protein
MDSVVFYLMLGILSTSFAATGQEEGCKACNCQFNNLEILTEFIESKLATGKLAKS